MSFDWTTVMFENKDKRRCGFSTTRDISYVVNQWSGRGDCSWHRIPRILCMEITFDIWLTL